MVIPKLKYTVGSVPYLNAKPLVRAFEVWGDESPVKVLYDVPSKLPAMLADNTAQAIMVSSIEALHHPGMRVAQGVCIGSQREVLSVRLFSKVPPKKIQSLALDQSSMTSNALARIILSERYGVKPVAEPMLPSLAEMLAEHDACVLIGDNGMREQGDGLHILDLGLEWFELTKLPFVWAVWLGDAGLSPELVKWLSVAEGFGASRLDRIISDGSTDTGIPLELCDRYFKKVMHYQMHEKELKGLREFGSFLYRYGIINQVHFPAIIAPDFTDVEELCKSFGHEWPRTKNRLP
jgi:chorismate dehydratase